MAELKLMPNEAVLLKDGSIAHGGVMAAYTDDLILTNINIICVSKGIFGNQKKVYYYPLNQIKRFNGKPQAIMGEMPNGSPCLEVYFMNGIERFDFQTASKKNVEKWIDAISKVICGDITNIDNTKYENEDTFADELQEMKDEFKAMGQELKEAFGFKSKDSKKIAEKDNETFTKKCMSCSAPLVGKKGQLVKCKYCDTSQTL